MEDCHKALSLDSALVKGHFFVGQALVELGRLDEAIVSFKKGMVLMRRNIFVPEILHSHKKTR